MSTKDLRVTLTVVAYYCKAKYLINTCFNSTAVVVYYNETIV